MPLVLIHAQAPWGPIRLGTAESMAEMLARLTNEPGQPPAHIEDVGERDPADVVREALRLLPPPMDATGFIPATVEKARNSVVDAVSRVLARVVAGDPAGDTPGRPESHGEAMASDGEVEAEFPQQVRASVREAAPGNRTGTGARRRPGLEVDARAIRLGLGLSQPAFAAAFGLKLAVLRDWEQGRTKPEGPARLLLMTIAHRPDVVREVATIYA